MATTTPNYGLSKPAGTDPVDISVLNDNSDIIDTALHELDEGKADQTDLEALEVEVNGKQNSLTFDSTPTEGSTNPVTSGGIYSAILRMAFGPGTLIPAAADNPIALTGYTSIGRFYIGATGAQYVTDRPEGLNYGFSLEVSTIFDNSRLRHKVYYNSPNAVGTYYERYLVSSGWTSWYKYTGEAVT